MIELKDLERCARLWNTHFHPSWVIYIQNFGFKIHHGYVAVGDYLHGGAKA